MVDQLGSRRRPHRRGGAGLDRLEGHRAALAALAAGFGGGLGLLRPRGHPGEVGVGHVAGERRHDHARVHRVGVQPLVGVAAVELEGEERVGRLRLPVGGPVEVLGVLEVGVVPQDRRLEVAGRRQAHDARRRGGEQRRQDEVGEEEVAEVVGAELHLEPVGGARERARHHAGVVDEQVDARVALDQLGGGLAHAGQRGQVEHERLHGGGGDMIGKRGDGVGHLGLVAGGEDDVGAVRRQRPGRLQAEPAGGTGDHRDGPGQVDAGEHLVGRAGRSERHLVPPGLIGAGIVGACREPWSPSVEG